MVGVASVNGETVHYSSDNNGFGLGLGLSAVGGGTGLFSAVSSPAWVPWPSWVWGCKKNKACIKRRNKAKKAYYKRRKAFRAAEKKRKRVAAATAALLAA